MLPKGPRPKGHIFHQGGVQVLVLSRQIGQAIKIGDNVEVRIEGMRGNQIRISIEAPREIEIHREEVRARILAEKVGVACPK